MIKTVSEDVQTFSTIGQLHKTQKLQNTATTVVIFVPSSTHPYQLTSWAQYKGLHKKGSTPVFLYMGGATGACCLWGENVKRV